VVRTLYDRPVKALMKEFVKSQNIKRGQTFPRKTAHDWFAKNFPKVKRGTVDAHLDAMSTNFGSRVHYSSAKQGSGNDLFFKISPGEYRLYEPENDPAPIYRDIPPRETKGNDEAHEEEIDIYDQEKRAFAYERDLQNYLVKNLNDLEKGLKVYEFEGISGVEYPAGGRLIDILAIDKENNFVVVELKVSKGYDRVVGQVLRYIAWVKKHVAEPGQHVRGIIVSREISDDLKLAVSQVNGVKLVEYELSLTFRDISP
jgi:hypothetical protein